MMNFTASRTYANLMSAYAGESQARVKYEIFATQARKEGYQQVGCVFDITAHNERAHAEKWLEYIHNNVLPPTLHNLQDAAKGEHFEWSEMYQQFAQTAREEGYAQIANSFTLAGTVEKAHEERYMKLISNMEDDELFKRQQSEKWACRNCGYHMEGLAAPAKCPLCGYAQAYYELDTEIVK